MNLKSDQIGKKDAEITSMSAATRLRANMQRHPHLSTNLVFSVLPAPDSPETMMDWLIFRTFMSL